ncbi:MAG: amidohydrolase family protein [Acidimicrobiia bacterium]|nr:amidohydrolase family protein [Acidimicrobiia bacterium]MCY4432031.1 amidohydrolase family protein [bacterium]
MPPRAIDCWVNVNMGDYEPPEHLIRVKEDYLHGGVDFFRSFTPEELLPLMDELGVEKALVQVSVGEDNPRPFDFVERYPERFALAVHLDPRGMMPVLWKLEDMVKQYPVALARVVPFGVDVPPSDPVYYPLYAKCTELDLPLSINTGIPGPPMPGEGQDPMLLDRICLRFPDLKLCMAHGADPWWGVAMRLMIKYKNLHLMTSAYSPKRLPAEFVHFMNTRGQDKVIFASDHPALDMRRCITEAWDLDLRDGVLDKYLYANAERLFFGPRNPRY